jgi:hypothetical protein
MPAPAVRVLLVDDHAMVRASRTQAALLAVQHGLGRDA